jgi:Acetyltransferase (GNAT) family
MPTPQGEESSDSPSRFRAWDCSPTTVAEGLGRALAVQAIQAARQAGMERIELEVFASNKPALALYQTMGFVTGGTKRRARKLDGQYDDLVCMGLLGDALIRRHVAHGTRIRRSFDSCRISLDRSQSPRLT